MRRTLLALAVLGSFALPGAAAADTVQVTLPTYNPHPWLHHTPRTNALILQAARATTPGTFCNGRVSWHFNAGAGHKLRTPDTGKIVGGYAVLSTCSIYVPTSRGFYETCIVASHELRHLAGIGHNDNPYSLMYGGGLERVETRGCDRAFMTFYKRKYQPGF